MHLRWLNTNGCILGPLLQYLYVIFLSLVSGVMRVSDIIRYKRALDLEVKSRVVNPYILCVLIQYRDLEHRDSVVLRVRRL